MRSRPRSCRIRGRMRCISDRVWPRRYASWWNRLIPNTVPRLAATSVGWAALGGIGASFLATVVVFTLLLPTTLVDFAPLSHERAFELSGLAGSAVGLVVARVAGGWRAVSIVGVYLAAVSYAISDAIQTFDFCMRARCPL